MPNMKLISSILKFLKYEMEKEPNPDTKESLEVAIQCLHTAYDLNPHDEKLNYIQVPLEDIFESAMIAEDEIGDESSTKEPLKKAEIMKNIGNNLMRSNQFNDAIRHYTAAIELDNKNAVYYCNRAAAYSRLFEYQNAIKDCEKAIEIDPKYAKAYGRMGLAYTSINQHDDAIKALKKAVELEPGNESYQSNLKVSLEKKDKPPPPATGPFLGLNNIDWNSLFSNPAFRNMATNIMQDPNIMNVLSAGMNMHLNQGAGVNNAAPTGTSNISGASGGNASGPIPNRGIDFLLEAGQYLTTQMEAANPDLAEHLRQCTRNDGSQSQDKKDPPSQ